MGDGVAPQRRRDTARQQRRRVAWWQIQTGQTARTKPSPDETRELLKAVDDNKTCAFGIGKLSRLELDGLWGPIPPWVRCAEPEGVMPLVLYAALRGRAAIVASLLNAGAKPLSRFPSAWRLDDGADDIEAALAEAGRRDAAQLLVSAARMVEAGARRQTDMSWGWVETNLKFAGCGCAVEPAQVWQALLARDYRCVACGLGGLPAEPVPRRRPKRHKEPWASLDAATKAKHVTTFHDDIRRGDVDVVGRARPELLDARDECGATAAIYAAVAGNREILRRLDDAGADLALPAHAVPVGSVTPAEVLAARDSPRLDDVGTRKAVPLASVHDAWLVHNALDAKDLTMLDNLYDRAPKLVSARQTGCDLERRHWIDASRWLEDRLAAALGRPICSAPRAKFLCYLATGAELRPHIDLAKHIGWVTQRARRRRPNDPLPTCSTHTWILYLTTAASAATVFLSDLDATAAVTETVLPQRGSLLVFPHRAPHAGLPLASGDAKLIARGELTFLDVG